MNRPIRLLPEARFEFGRDADWYEDRRAGLGVAFIARIGEVFERIASDPERYPAIDGEVRRAIVDKYPYVVL